MKNGKHNDGFKYRNRRNKSSLGKNSFLGTVITTIVGSIVKDLISDNSKITYFFKKILHPAQIENKQEQKEVIEADYSVLNDKSPEEKTKKLEQN
jgi:hypothetical protein